MDLIYTNAQKKDLGVLSAYAFDFSFGETENNFEMVLSTDDAALEYGAFLYIEGTEYGGIVDAKRSISRDQAITYIGRTWHGMMNSKIIQPDTGADYFTISGMDANAALGVILARLGLSDLFSAAEIESGINVSNYQFNRYCKGYDGIRAMLLSVGAKLRIEWIGRAVVLSAIPIVDYTTAPIDSDTATLTVENHEKKVNHLICLGRGDLAEREVLHLYIDGNGNISETQHFFGLAEIVDTYDYSNAESSEELRKGGIERMAELRNIDKADIALLEDEKIIYDVGDIVPATDIVSGITASAAVTQKIVKISNGAITTEYKTGSVKKNG